ncbi:hypothetical protein QBC40DRAFT_209750 [Triangularia verruculosa]|uniref:C2H2-type domain-containing protein n=1 Tax=Triangularia verruculosa TaxID=2587418 RepID=A0AAN7ARB4_9PEZI|nr:hypothetical protein QBC40DRAFT_209750 [Triangularia verruculosa]
MADPSSPKHHDRRQQYRDALPPFSLPPSSGFPLPAADDRSPPASGLHSPSSAYSVSATSSPGFQPASMSLKPPSQHQDPRAQGQYYGARKPLPGSPPQPSSPSRFSGQLPPITSLLQPTAQYHGPLHPNQAGHGHHLPGPLAPPVGMVSHQHHPSMYMHQGYGQPPPSLPSMAGSGGPYHEFNVQVGGVYPVSRESSHQDRPFKCDICSQCFSRNHDLKRHRRIHSATKPFPCPNCDKCFSRKDALKRHKYVKACSGKKSPAGAAVGEASTAAEEDEYDEEEEDLPALPSSSSRKSHPSSSSKPQFAMKELKPKEPKVPRFMTSKFTFTKPLSKIEVVPALTSTAMTLPTPSAQTGKRWIIYTLENGDTAVPDEATAARFQSASAFRSTSASKGRHDLAQNQTETGA